MTDDKRVIKLDRKIDKLVDKYGYDSVFEAAEQSCDWPLEIKLQPTHRGSYGEKCALESMEQLKGYYEDDDPYVKATVSINLDSPSIFRIVDDPASHRDLCRFLTASAIASGIRENDDFYDGANWLFSRGKARELLGCVPIDHEKLVIALLEKVKKQEAKDQTKGEQL